MALKCNRCGFLTLFIFVVFVIYWRFTKISTPTNEEDTSFSNRDASHGDHHRVAISSLLSSSIAAAKLGGFEVHRLAATTMQDQLNIRTKGKTLEGANDPVTDADLRSHCAMWRRLANAHPNVRIVSEEEADNAKCEHIELLHDTLGDMDVDAVASVDGSDETTTSVDDVTIWIDPLDATQEFTEQLHQYVTVMVCVAIRGRPIIGVIHNPFTHETHWSWNRQSISSTTFAAQHPLAKTNNNNNIPTTTPRNRTIIVSRSHVGNVDTLVRNALGAQTTVVHAGGAGYKVLQVTDGKADAYVHSTRIKKWDLCAGNAILEAWGGNMTDLHGNRIDYAATANKVNENGVVGTILGREHAFYVQRLSDTLKNA